MAAIEEYGGTDPLINRTIEDYRIEERIGEGGGAVVYKAVGLHDKDIKVAVKVIRQSALMDSRRRAAFKREARIQNKLDHPNVLKVFRYVGKWVRPAIIMEYFRGDSLRRLMAQKMDMLRENKVRILYKAAQALAYIHKQGIIHRDVKPENLLVSDDFDVKLIDFSLARTKWGSFLSFLSRERQGTPTYMSPEQILRKMVDHRADIYSFGVLMYELLTEAPPFTAKHQDDLFLKHLKETPKRLRKVNEQTPRELEPVVEKMLAKKPSERYNSMDSVAYVLGKLLVR